MKLHSDGPDNATAPVPRSRNAQACTDARQRSVRVLQGFPYPTDGAVFNPYTFLLMDALSAQGVEARYFSWKRGLFWHYDVLHVHWPEFFLRNSRRSRRLLKPIFASALLLRLKILRTPIVRTVHNEFPHEGGGPFERWFLAQIDKMTTEWVTLNSFTRVPRDSPSTLIPHGHYRDWYNTSPRPYESGKILAFGLIRPYKGFERLLSVFQAVAVDRPDLELSIVGSPYSPTIRDTMISATASHPRIRLELRFVPDSELVEEIASAEMAVFPYEAMHNSGAALLALSLHRPILVPNTSITQDLEAEFGSEWVFRYEHPLTAEGFELAIGQLRSQVRREGGPDMSTRDWQKTGESLATIFERVSEPLRRGRRWLPSLHNAVWRN